MDLQAPGLNTLPPLPWALAVRGVQRVSNKLQQAKVCM